MADRERLPDRRGAELIDFEHGARRWTATIGRFATMVLSRDRRAPSHVRPLR